MQAAAIRWINGFFTFVSLRLISTDPPPVSDSDRPGNFDPYVDMHFAPGVP
jgi:hypothetical protein